MAKIAHIITRLDTGGSSENTLATVEHLAKKGHGVTLFYGPSRDFYLPQPPVSVPQVPTPNPCYVLLPSLVRNVSLLKDLITLWQLTKIMRRERFDIVHTHSSKAGFLGRLAATAAKTRVIVHTPHGHVFYGYFGPLKTWMFLTLERLCARLTHDLIALTETGVKEYQHFRVRPRKRLVAIPSGVDLSAYHPNGTSSEFKKDLRIPEITSVVGFVGRLDPIKGASYFLEAAKILILSFPGTTRFILVGDGEERHRLQSWVNGQGLAPWIIFTGVRHDIAQFLSIFDVFVSSSLNEGMGRTLVQAQAAGVPVVATDVGGVRDVVCANRTGILVPSKDSQSLADAIVKLLCNPILAETYGSNGRAWVTELCDGYPRFSQERMLHLLDKLYKETL